MKGKNFMKVWFLQCSVLLNRNCLILPFESTANDNDVFQCNWLMEKVQYVKEPRRKRRGRKGVYLFFLSVIWQPDELWEFVKIRWPCPDRIVLFLFLGAALMANGILFLSFCQTVIMYCVYKSTSSLIFAKWSFKISLPPWISNTA